MNVFASVVFLFEIFGWKTCRKSSLIASSQDQVNIKGETWRSRRDAYTFCDIFVSNSWFIHCRNYEASGGAILSLSPMSIFNSKFYHCASGTGGALCVHNDLNISRVSFSRCLAREAGGAMYIKFGNAQMESSSGFFNTVAGSGGFSFCKLDNLGVKMTNISYTSARDGGAAFMIPSKNVSIDTSVFSFLVNGRRGASLKLKSYSKCTLRNLVFSRCKSAEHSETSAALDFEATGDHNPGTISNSVFYKCSVPGSYFSIRKRKSDKLIISNCMFGGREKCEINSNLNVVLKNNEFEVEKFPKNVPKHRKFVAPIAYVPSIMVVRECVDFVSHIVMNALVASCFVFLVGNCAFLVYKERKKMKIMKKKMSV